MQQIRHYRDWPTARRGAVVVLGNFDGVHRGHQAVIGAGRQIAAARQSPLAVMTFEPHPRAFFQPSTAPFRLTCAASKVRLLADQGVEIVLSQHFDAEFSSLAAESFVQDVLVNALGASAVVAGYDFTFGKRRSGNVELLVELGRRWSFETVVVDPVTLAGEVYSSTRIREALRGGMVAEAAQLLGHWPEIEGQVVPGDQIGRTLGFPTANVALGDFLVPKFGVYAVWAADTADPTPEWRPGVASIGVRPTVGGTKPVFEVYLFDFASDLYGKTLRVALVEFMRPEAKFDGLEPLKAQIAADADAARALLARERFAPTAAATSTGS